MTKRDKINLLLKSTNVGGSAQQMFQQIVGKFPDENDPMLMAFKEKIVEKFTAIQDEYVAQQIAIYEKWLTEEAIDASIAFYSSPGGQSVVNSMPHINAALLSLGMKVSEDILKELQQEGILPEFGGDDPGEFGYGRDFKS